MSKEPIVLHGGDLKFDVLVTALGRVVNDPETYLEIKFLGLTLRVYPSRVNSDASSALRLFAEFMVALSDELGSLPTRFAFCQLDDTTLEMGVMKSDGVWVFLPVEIIAFDITAVRDEATAMFPFLDAETNAKALPAFRRIRV